MVAPSRHDGQVVAALFRLAEPFVHLQPFAAVELEVHLHLGALLQLHAQLELAYALLVRIVLCEVSELGVPCDGFLLGGFRRVLHVARDPHLALVVEQEEVPAEACKVSCLGRVLGVPQALLRVVDVQQLAVRSRHADVIFQPIAAADGVLEAVHAERRSDWLWDTAGVDHDARAREVEERLARNGKAPAASVRYAQRSAPHDLKIARERAVDLVDVVLLEEDRVAEEGDAAGKLARAAGVHRVAVRIQPLEHVPVERIAQL